MGRVRFGTMQVISGENLRVAGRDYYVDGVKQEVNYKGADEVRTVTVDGDMEVVQLIGASAQVVINGSVGALTVHAGDVKCGDVLGNVVVIDGDLHCRKLKGSARVSGDMYEG